MPWTPAPSPSRSRAARATGAPRRRLGGTGLVGLDERVRLAGGTLAHGPGAGGFTVTARLPLSPGVRPAAPAPTTAGELHDARRRVRRNLLQAVTVPLAAGLALALLILGFRFWSDSRTVMDPAQYDALRVGDTRAEVLTRLPGSPRRPAGRRPAGAGRGGRLRVLPGGAVRGHPGLPALLQGRPAAVEDGRHGRGERRGPPR
ncbi:hypothetical protein ACFQ60_32830 [Streptomyces zhihengii]